jgi:hypothetical protein
MWGDITITAIDAHVVGLLCSERFFLTGRMLASSIAGLPHQETSDLKPDTPSPFFMFTPFPPIIRNGNEFITL